MLKVAITGGIASGKSYALKCALGLGYSVISADEEIQKIYKDEAVLSQLSLIFKVKNITKEALKPIVLKDKSKLKILEKILYKKLYSNFDKFERNCRLKGYKLCFFEIPLLFEKKTHNKYDYIINIEAPIFIQKARFLARKVGGEADFYKFVNLQLHILQKKHLLQRQKGVNILNIYNKNRFKHQVKMAYMKFLKSTKKN